MPQPKRTTRKRTTAKQAVEEDPRTVTYLCEKQSPFGNKGTSFQFQVPEHWEVTYSYVNPGEAKGSHCVRVYEPMPTGMTKKLRAVYADVTSIRDLDIPHAVKIERSESEEEFKQDSRGNFELRRNRRQLEAQWQEDDEPAF